MRSPITTHVLDTALGKPAEGVGVSLFIKKKDNWEKLANGITNFDGRVEDLLSLGSKTQTGCYKIIFYTKEYFIKGCRKCFYPQISVCFELEDPEQHYHIPLLLSGFGYSTYRGS